MSRLATLLAALVSFAVLETDASRSPANVAETLTRYAGFSASDLKKIDRGEVVARSLGADGDEVALAAAVVIRVPLHFYLQGFRDIESFKKSAEVQQIGRFAEQPAVGDLRPLTIDGEDVEDLRECRPGACDLKVTDNTLARLSGRADVEAAFKEWLADYAARYAREGNAALAVYHHEKTPRRSVESLQRIVERLPFLRDTWPALGAAIGSYTGRVPSGFEQFIYWSKEKPPGKVVVNLTHVVMQPETAGTAVIATKQIYASRYMHSSLGLSVLIDRTTAEGPRTLVIYMNRTHVDLFDGLGRMIRPVVRSRARASSERLLGRLRTRLEADWAARPVKQSPH